MSPKTKRKKKSSSGGRKKSKQTKKKTNASLKSKSPGEASSRSTSKAKLKRKKKPHSKKAIATPRLSLTLEPYFYQGSADPLDGILFRELRSTIRDPDGNIVSEMSGISVPEAWSQLAVDILASKYLRKTGIPESGHENSLKQVIERITKTLEAHSKLCLGWDQKTATQFRKELSVLLVHQMGAFNSPVWFNCGLFQTYGIQGRKGHFRFDEKKKRVIEVEDNYKFPQASACFIQSVQDDLLAIFDLLKSEAMLFKYGSGSGTNFSSIRGKEEPIEGGAKASGVLSFLDVFDRAAGATKSGGVTRRAAKMVVLDCDHPEVVDFIRWKAKEEKKAKILIQAGFDADFEGEAYRTVGGQNANHSVRVSDAFMKAVETNQSWLLIQRTSGAAQKTLPAKQIWKEMAQAAWECADPGVQFEDTIQSWHTCPKSGPIRASNPCSEYLFLDDSACNLASLNLVKFLPETMTFEHEAMIQAVERFVLAGEVLVSLSSYPTAQIAENSFRFRPLGIGYANLGSFLMRQGMAYDSDSARSWAAALTALMTGVAYRKSAQMAQSLGPFDGFSENRTEMLKVIERHCEALDSISLEVLPEKLTHVLKREWNEAFSLGKKVGYRNAQVTVLAPTGTIGLLMDCDTTGIEPDYALVKYKKLSGGGFFKIVNQSVPLALHHLGYNDAQVEAILQWIAENETIEGAPHLKQEHLAVFDCANRCGENGQRFIAPSGHLKMMAAVQPFLSGGISKTVNLPKETTVEEIQSIFLDAWKLGVKAVSVYRDGSKSSQPLSTHHQSLKSTPTHSEPGPSTESQPTRRFSPRSDEAIQMKCAECGHATIQSGSCFRCLNCGRTTGCG